MKILILSDSHSSLHFMREAIRYFSPNAVIHLGDYYDDGQTIAEEFPSITVYQVPGNCDKYRVFDKPEVLCLTVFGALLYMTPGHNHGVKMTRHRLKKEAAQAGAQAALYGHTHVADCRFEGDLWVLNPGSCGYGGGSCGLLEVDSGKIISCRIMNQQDLEELQ